MFRRRKDQNQQFQELISTAVLVIGLIVIAIILILMVRIQRGLLGIILAAAAAVLLFYWLGEVRKSIKREWLPDVVPKTSEWTYDIIQQNGRMTVVAEIPGPESQVRVTLEERVLKIYGGQGFFRKIELSENVEIEDSTYQNGVLQVRLKKVETT